MVPMVFKIFSVFCLLIIQFYDYISSELHYLEIAEKEFLKRNMILTSSLFKANLGELDWDIVAAACNQFSSTNKVGQGGLGSIYKVTLILNHSYFSPSTKWDGH